MTRRIPPSAFTALAVAWIIGFGASTQSQDSKPTELPGLSYYQKTRRGESQTLEFEVAVYGGTPAGVTSAIEAARSGRKTVLLSFDQHVGGLTSGGLTATDLGQQDSIGGLALEFYKRIGKKKGFSPANVETLYRKMLEEEGVTVLLGRALESVEMKENRLVSISMETGETFRANVFLDTTYEGDLLAASNVSYRVGREPAAAYKESLGGQWQEVSWKNVYQFCRLPVSPYIEPGDPESGLLPEIRSEPAGKPGEGDYRVQAYNFRMHLSRKPGKISFPKPASYDPDRYALLERFLNFEPTPRWTLNYTTAPMTDGPVQMREGDSNNAGSFSSDYVGGNHYWPDGTYRPESFSQLPPARRGLPIPLAELYQKREEIFQDHVNYQAGQMYFLANDPGVPKELQERVNQFGLDPEEFQNTSHWPHALYVREGRRMVSDYVVTQADCESKRVAEDSVGLASYPMDSHFCQRVVVVEKGATTVRNEGGFGHGCPVPYPVSYRAIVPKKSECVNLLVPLCLSSSHVAYGSIRMEPVFMILGQSAGAAAALAIEKGIAVQDVDYKILKYKLEAGGQILKWEKSSTAGKTKPLEGLVVDDPEAEKTGAWTTGILTPVVGAAYVHDGNRNKGKSTLSFQIKVPEPGDYELRLLYLTNQNRSTATPVTIVSGDVEKTVEINQRTSDRSLGIHTIKESVTISVSNANTDGFVVVDGIQILSRK